MVTRTEVGGALDRVVEAPAGVSEEAVAAALAAAGASVSRPSAPPGASAALGLARALQDGADPHFRLGAVAPISGGYDFENAEIPALLAGDHIPPKLAVAYVTYLLVSWNRLHHLYDSPTDVFQAPYAAEVDRLFDSDTPGPQMLAALPDTLDQLLTRGGFDLLRHPDAPFAQALHAADSICADWLPTAPARLYYAAGDEQAVTTNTEHCQAQFHATGLDLTPIDLGPDDYQGSRHLGTEITGTTAVLKWFTTLNSPARAQPRR